MRAKTWLLATVAGTSVIGLAKMARGSVVEQFDFQGNTGSETTVSASSVATGVTASVIARGPGFQPNSSFDTNAFGNYPVTNGWGNSAASAEGAGEYDTFSITPAAADLISLNQVVFAFESQNGNDPTYGNPAFNATLEYSLDNLTFTPINSQTDNTSGGGFDNSPYIATVDTSGVAALQAITSTVYFRIDLYNIGGYQPGGIGSSSGGSEDLVLNGTVTAATPEPASLGILSLAALGLLTRHRTRRG